MNEKKYNHYIPKFYLANFSGNLKCIDKCLLNSARIIRNAPTSSTAGADHLYGKDSRIEDAFSELEGTWATIVREIINTREIPRDLEKVYNILLFFVLSDARTLTRANETLDFWGKQYRILARMLKEHGRLDVPDHVIEHIGATMETPNIFAFKKAAYAFELCLDLRLDLIENISDMQFITSDRPVAKYNQLFMDRKYYRSFDYGHMGIQIYLPISPRYCLILYDPIPYNIHKYYRGKFIINNANDVKKINRLILGYADKEIYFGPHSSNRTIQKLLANRDSNALTPTSGVWGGGDHYFLFDSEPSYWRNINSDLLTTRKVFFEIDLPPHMGGPLRPRVAKMEQKREEKGI